MLDELDIEVFQLFYQKAGLHKEELKQLYKQYMQLTSNQSEYLEIANLTLNTINPLYSNGNSIEFVNKVIYDLKHDAELKLKRVFRDTISNKILTSFENQHLLDKLNGFLNKDYAYFINGEFQTNELAELTELIQSVADMWNNHRFRLFKKILEDQIKFQQY